MRFNIVIDAQNDFITGNLGSPEAFDAYEMLVKYLTHLEVGNDVVIFTQDTHSKDTYTDTVESNRVVAHCFKDNWGWKIPTQIRELFNNSPYVIEKETFGTFKLPIEMSEIFGFDPIEDEIVICGFCTDICVISNALILRTAFPSAKIAVLANACAGTSPVNHVNALEVMKSNLIEVHYFAEAIPN